jgi:hypothetical protein
MLLAFEVRTVPLATNLIKESTKGFPIDWTRIRQLKNKFLLT